MDLPDVILSSGFLAFGAQAGFLRGLETHGVPVDAMCGTSSGALAGSLWAAGMPATDILMLLTERSPLRNVRLCRRPWHGLFSMKPVIDVLRQHLPATFEELPIPFAVGVMNTERQPTLIDSGPLPEAVAASCAIPRLFQPVTLAERRWADGGMVDRTGMDSWRKKRPNRRIILHWVDRTQGIDIESDLSDVTVIRTPSAGATFWNLGDVHGRYYRARAITESTSCT